MSKKIIYPGTFDPVTLGHLDLIQRACTLADEVIIAVAENTDKQTLFTLDERIKLINLVTTHYPKVSVVGFKGLLVEFARANQCNLLLRGLRAVSDFEFEFQLAIMNRHLDENIETMFLTPNEKYTFISSTIVKEIAKLDGKLSDFVPIAIEKKLHDKYNKKNNSI